MTKLFIVILLLPSLAFSQARIRNNPLNQGDTIVLVDNAIVNQLKGSLSFPFELKACAQDYSHCENMTATASLGTVGNFTQIKVTRGVRSIPQYFAENDLLDLTDTDLVLGGVRVNASQIQTTTKPFNYSQLPTQLTGSVNVGTISTNANIPMLQHLYEAVVGASLTLTASNGVAGQTVYLVFTTSGTTTRTVTFGSGFRSANLVTGTISGKHFKMSFIWNDIDNVWDEVARTAAQ